MVNVNTNNKTVLMVVLMSLGLMLLSACGQAPVEKQSSQAAVFKPFVCSTDGGTQVSISLPNECNVEGIYCVMADEAYDSKDVHIKKDSCEYKMLLNLNVVDERGGWN